METETSSDCLVRFLLGEFKSFTRNIVTLICQQSIDTDIILTVYLSRDLEPEFDQLISGLQMAARHFLPVILKALITWREYQTFDPEEMKQRVRDEKTRLSLKDAVAVMVERHHLLIDYIFSSTLLRIFEAYDQYAECSQSSNMLDLGSTWKELFSISLKYFIDRANSSRISSPQNASNRDTVDDLFSMLIRCLASRQFDMVLTILSETKSLLGSTDLRPKGIAHLTALSSVLLPIPIDRSGAAFFAEFDAIFKLKNRDAIKAQVIDTLGSILQNTASQYQTDFRQAHGSSPTDLSSLRDGHAVFKHMYEEYAAKKKKGMRSTSIFSSSSTTQANGSILCPLLCMSDVDFFNTHSTTFINNLAAKLQKETLPKEMALSLFTLLCQAHLTTHAGSFVTETQKITHISAQVFHKRWTISLQPKDDSLYVDFIFMLAQYRLDLALHRLREIFAMSEATTMTERHIIIAKSILKILKAAYNKYDSWASEDLEPLAKQVSPHAAASELSSSSDRASSGAPLLIPANERALDRDRQINLLSYENVVKLSDQFESLLGGIIKKSNLLSTPNEKTTGRALDLVRTATKIFPFCVPAATTLLPRDLGISLARLFIHPNESLALAAATAQRALIATRPDFRPYLAAGIADFVLSIPDSQPKVIARLLTQLNRLLHQWVEHLALHTGAEQIISRADFAAPSTNQGGSLLSSASAPGSLKKAPEPPPSPEMNPTGTLAVTPLALPTSSSVSAADRSALLVPSASLLTAMLNYGHMEAIALVFLCSPSTFIRKLALDILQATRSIAHASFEQFFQRTRDGRPSDPSNAAAATAESKANPPSSRSLPEVRVLDILEEIGQNSFNLFNSDCLFHLNFDCKPFLDDTTPEVSFFSLLGQGDSAQQQLIWMYVYSRTLSVITQLSPTTVLSASPIVSQRLLALSPETVEKPFPSTDSSDTVSQLLGWRNYMTFICAAAHTRSIDHASQTLSKHILPFIRSPLADFRTASCFALQRITHEELLLVLIRGFEDAPSKSSTSVRRPRKSKSDNLSIEAAQVLSSIALRLPSITTRSRLDSLHASLVAHLLAAESYLFKSVDENFLGDGRTKFRVNFCYVVLSLTQVTALPAQLSLTPRIRKKLFKAILSWCRGAEDDNFIRLTAMQDSRKAKSFTTDPQIRAEVLLVQHTACQTAAELLKDTIFIKSLRSRSNPLTWIDSLLKHARHDLVEIGQTALFSFMYAAASDTSHNLSREITDLALRHCYGTEPALSKGYFLALTAICQTHNGLSILTCDLPVLVALIIFQSGVSQLSVRKNAIDLLQLLPLASTPRTHEGASPSKDPAATPRPIIPSFSCRLDHIIPHLAPETDAHWEISYDPITMLSEVPDTYVHGQMVLSTRLARSHPEFSPAIINDIISRLDGTTPGRRTQMFRYLIPWLQNIDLTQLASRAVVPLTTLLNNMLYVTYRFNETDASLVEDLWHTLANTSEHNVVPLFDFLIHSCCSIKNPEILVLAKRVALYIGRTKPILSIETLVGELTALKKKQVERGSSSIFSEIFRSSSQAQLPMIGDVPDTAPRLRPHSLRLAATMILNLSSETPRLDRLLRPVENFDRISKTHFSIILLSELSSHIVDEFRAHLPVVLHQLIIGLDFPNIYVFDHCRLLLMNLLNSFVITPYQASLSSPAFMQVFLPNADQRGMMELIFDDVLELDAILRAGFSRPLWDREQISSGHHLIRSADFVSNLVKLVRSALSITHPTLAEGWAAEALSWALSCPIAHLRCRSHQVYRALESFTNDHVVCVEMIDSIRKLSRACQHRNRVAVIIETLLTLRHVVERVPTSRLLLSNHIFWSAVALLNSDFEDIFSASLDLMISLFSRLNFAETSVQSVFLASVPREWGSDFLGIIPLLFRGILNPALAPKSYQLLSIILPLSCDDIFHPLPNVETRFQHRLLFLLLSALPLMCLAAERRHQATTRGTRLKYSPSISRLPNEDDDTTSDSTGSSTHRTAGQLTIARTSTHTRSIELICSGAFRRAALSDLSSDASVGKPAGVRTPGAPPEKCPHGLKIVVVDSATKHSQVNLPHQEAASLLSRSGLTYGSMRGLAPNSAHKALAFGFDSASSERVPNSSSGTSAPKDNSDDDAVHDDEVDDNVHESTLNLLHTKQRKSGYGPNMNQSPTDVLLGTADLANLSQRAEIWLGGSTISVVSIDIILQIIQHLVATCEQHQLTDLGAVLQQFTNPSSQQIGSSLVVDRLLQQLRGPLLRFAKNYLEFTFEILFQMLDLGPSSYKLPILKIIGTLLTGVEDVASLNAKIAKHKDHWLITLARFARTSMANEALEVINVIMSRSPLSFRHAETSSLRNLPPFGSETPVFPNASSDGMKTVVRQLEYLLGKNTLIEPGMKSEMVAPPRFFTDMLNIDTGCAFSDSEDLDATEDMDDTAEPFDDSPRDAQNQSTGGGGNSLESNTVSASEDTSSMTSVDEDHSDESSSRSIDSYSGRSLHSRATPSSDMLLSQAHKITAKPSLRGFEDVFDMVSSGDDSSVISDTSISSINTEVTHEGKNLNLADIPFERETVTALLALFNFDKSASTSSTSCSSASAATMIYMLPLAWTALQQIRDDYSVRNDDYIQSLPPADKRTLRPLGADLLSYSIFNPPFESADDSRFKDILSRYAKVCGDSPPFGKTFEANLFRLYECFKLTLLEYLALKVSAEGDVDLLLSEPEKVERTKFISTLLKLHHSLLRVYQMHINLQASVNEFAPGLVDEFKQSSAITEELSINASLCKQFKKSSNH